MKLFTTILLVILAGAVLTAAAISYLAWTDLDEARSAYQEQEVLAKDVRKRVGEVNLKYRATMEGMKAVPDSLKMQYSGEYQRKLEVHRKQLFVLEGESREAERILKKRKNAIVAARKSLHWKLMVLGGAAILLLAAFVLRARAIRT